MAIFCATCGQPLSLEHIKKSKSQGRVPKYCSVTCWGKREREHNYDHTFLNEDTELAAYFMGWWTADGHFSKDDGIISITSKDKQLIDDFVERIHFGNTVSERWREGRDAPEYSLRVAGDVSRRIQEMGYKKGAKGGLEFLPERFSDGELFFHFLRGFIDGDGSIGLREKGDLRVSMVNMSCELLFTIWDYLYFNKLIRGGAINETRPDFYKLQFGHFDSVQIGNLIYKNATIKLDRKYQNYLAGKDFVQGSVPQGNTTCSVPGCARAAKVHGLCKRHFDKDYQSVYYLDPVRKAARYATIGHWARAHRDEINARRRERYAEDPEQHKAEVKKYGEEHPDKVRETKRKHRVTHREEVNASKRAYREKNLEKAKEQERAAYYRTQEARKARCRKYYEEHKEEQAARTAEYRETHKEELKEYFKRYQEEHKEEISARRRARYAAKKLAKNSL